MNACLERKILVKTKPARREAMLIGPYYLRISNKKMSAWNIRSLAGIFLTSDIVTFCYFARNPMANIIL